MSIADDVRHILDRLEIDGAKDDAELLIVHRADGAFRRILLNQLPSGTVDPARYLTAADLRVICKAALRGLTIKTPSDVRSELGQTEIEGWSWSL